MFISLTCDHGWKRTPGWLCLRHCLICIIPLLNWVLKQCKFCMQINTINRYNSFSANSHLCVSLSVLMCVCVCGVCVCVCVCVCVVCVCVCVWERDREGGGSTRSCWPFYKLRRVWEFPSCSDLSIKCVLCACMCSFVGSIVCVFSLSAVPLSASWCWLLC